MGYAGERFVREAERRIITGRSRAQWGRDEKTGTAPRGVKIGKRAVAWKLSELLQWMDSREALTAENIAPAVAPEVKRGRKKARVQS